MKSGKKVYVFPIEFASLKDNLTTFFARLFEANPFADSPVFRGFYFTSGTQTGESIDRVSDAMAAYFGLRSRGAESEKKLQERSYFLKRLFKGIIIQDKALVRKTSSNAILGGIKQAGLITAMLALLLLFLGANIVGLRSSKGELLLYENAGQQLRTIQLNSTSYRNDLQVLTNSYNVLYNAKPPFWGKILGFFPSSKLNNQLETEYNENIRGFIENIAYRELKEELNRASRLQATQDESYRSNLEGLAGALKLLTDGVELLGENERQANTNHLNSQLLQLTKQRIERESSTFVSSEEMVQFRTHIEAFTSGLSNQKNSLLCSGYLSS